MTRQGLVDFLFPRDESRDSGFRNEVDRLSAIGLRVVSALSVSIILLVLVVGAVLPEFHDHRDATFSVLFLSLGAAGLALSFWRPAYSRARILGLAIGYVVATTSLGAMMTPSYELSVDMVHAHMPIIVSISLLVLVVSLPLKPVHTLGYGMTMLGSYLGLTGALRTTKELTGMIGLHVILEFLVILLGTGLTALLYHQRSAGFRSRRLAEESFEELKAAQARLLLSRNAASQSRLAAALTHELATPLGALSSALDTVGLAVDKLLPADINENRLGTVARDSLQAARASSDRLRGILARLKHVTNLEGGEERILDLNELWRDTVALLESEIAPKADVRFDLKASTRTRCRPEQISAVFSNLLRNAAAAMDRRGVIEVRTASPRGAVVSEVRDSGRGMAPETLEYLFEPAFRVEGTRIATSHWGLFLSRSIVVEHGGEIEIESELGRGTTARVVLPVR